MWTVQLHGSTESLKDTDARDWEMEFSHRLHTLVADLVPGGHTGVAATFTGDHVGTVNLTDPQAPPEGTPAPDDGVKADGTPEPAPTEPPPAFPNGEQQ